MRAAGASAPLYLGVDGGGTSTELLLTDAEGNEVARHCVGSTSAKSVGKAAAYANLADAARWARETAAAHGAEPEDVHGTWGLSGCDSEADRMALQEVLASCGLAETRHRVCNDALLALRTITAGAGVVVIAGTGSVAFCVDESGEQQRFGGWGYQASDLGSGFWVGAQLLREALLFADGCREDDPAFVHVLAKLAEDASCSGAQLHGHTRSNDDARLRGRTRSNAGAQTHSGTQPQRHNAQPRSTTHFGENPPERPPESALESPGEAAMRLTQADEVAAFARIALECENSPVCAQIRHQAARYLAGYALSADKALAQRGCLGEPIVLAGGLFRNERFCALVTSEIDALSSSDAHASNAPSSDAGKRVRWASASAAYGGILMARARAEQS